MKMSFKVKHDRVTKHLEAMVKNTEGQSLKAFFNRQFYPEYQEAQIKRWKTEGASQGDEWDSLNPIYKKYKLKAFAKFPYSGRRMMIAEGLLFPSVVGESGGYHRKLISKDGIRIATVLDYALYVDDARSFSTWSKKQLKIWRDDLSDHIRKVKIKGAKGK